MHPGASPASSSRCAILAALSLAACAAPATGTPAPAAPRGSTPMLARVAALIERTATPDQLTAEHVGAELGVQLTADPNEPGHFGATTPVTASWAFDIEGSREHGLVLGYRPNHDGVAATEICDPDALAFTDRLVKLGFTRAEWIGEHGRRMGYLLAREGWSVRIGTIGETDARAEHACVRLIEIH